MDDEVDNRFAIPLTTLVGGAYVALTEQVVEQPVEQAVPQWAAGAVPLGDGGDVDGD